MSYRFSQKSMERLNECHPDLQRIAFELIKEMDVVILCGHRDEKEQNEAFARGTSKLKFPKSKHNKIPSLAMDICPYKNGIDWKDLKAFAEMCARIERIAKEHGIKIRLGRDFSFKDYPHVELI